MIKVFGYNFNLPNSLKFLSNKYGSFLITILIWVVIAILISLIFKFFLRRIVRKTSTEIDNIILDIIYRPLIIFIASFGAVNSLGILELPTPILTIIERIFNSILVILVSWFIFKLIKEIFVYYGEKWAKKTESRIDDIIIPIINIFGTFTVILIALLIIFPIWGVNITSVLVGAGVISLVIGLALQETLSNIFGGISLLVDAPFKTGDILVLPETKICQVKKIGIRTTELYFVDEDSTVYVPNKDLANTTIINITKPTVDLKTTIDFNVSYDSDLMVAEKIMEDVAISHPNVLITDSKISKKLSLIEEKIKLKKEIMKKEPHKERTIKESVEKLSISMLKLKKEKKINHEIKILISLLKDLVQDIKRIESGGVNREEINELYKSHIIQIEKKIEMVKNGMINYIKIPDPWIDKEEEQKEENDRWLEQNSKLIVKFNNLKRVLCNPKMEHEMRLDDMTESFMQWIKYEYKLIDDLWKDPCVKFRNFGDSCISLQLEFYIDDICLEHFERKKRVVKEIAMEIYNRFKQNGITIPSS